MNTVFIKDAGKIFFEISPYILIRYLANGIVFLQVAFCCFHLHVYTSRLNLCLLLSIETHKVFDVELCRLWQVQFRDFVQLCYGFITILFRLYVHQSFKVINIIVCQNLHR